MLTFNVNKVETVSKEIDILYDSISYNSSYLNYIISKGQKNIYEARCFEAGYKDIIYFSVDDKHNAVLFPALVSVKSEVINAMCEYIFNNFKGINRIRTSVLYNEIKGGG